jgi:hypothetical protein
MSSNSDSVIKLKLQACKVDSYVQVPDSFLSLCMKPEDCCKLSHSSTKLFALIQDDCLLAQESLNTNENWLCRDLCAWFGHIKITKKLISCMTVVYF